MCVNRAKAPGGAGGTELRHRGEGVLPGGGLHGRQGGFLQSLTRAAGAARVQDRLMEGQEAQLLGPLTCSAPVWQRAPRESGPTPAPSLCMDDERDSDGKLVARLPGEEVLTGNMENCMKRQVSSRVVST